MHVSDINRYLRASAYLDYRFRDKVLQGILHEQHASIGISHDVDVPSLVLHCIAARRRLFVRDILAIAFSLIGALLFLLLLADPDENKELAGAVLVSSFGLSVICVVWETVNRHDFVTKHFRDNYDPDYRTNTANPTVKSALERISTLQKANVIVYSGFSPFVGSGLDLGGWSFSLNLKKGKETLEKTHEPESFTVQELYSCLDDALKKLNFDGLTTEDRLFVNGKDIRKDKRFLPDPLSQPQTIVDPEFISEFKDKPTHTVRHYMCVRITDWKGELTLSVFLRLAKHGATFFAEVNYFLLTPVAESYRQIDRSNNGTERLLLISSAFINGVLIWNFAAFLLLFKIARFIGRISERNGRRRQVEEDPTFDYGATGSLREYVSSQQYRRYFQKLDKEMYLKTVERLILDCIIRFLDEKGVDTSELKDRQATILNNGVIVTGGALSARSLAVGQKATASHRS